MLSIRFPTVVYLTEQRKFISNASESIIEFDKINNLFIVAMKIATDEERSLRELT